MSDPAAPADAPLTPLAPQKKVSGLLIVSIVLTLAGRFENFTLGRTIEWEKVHEIYKLGLKHGMQLAAISGVNGVYSDEDIARVRELALEALKGRKKPAKKKPAKKAPAKKTAAKKAAKRAPAKRKTAKKSRRR